MTSLDVSARNKRSFILGWKLIISVQIIAVVLGIALIIPPLDIAAESFMGKSLADIREFSPKVADWIWHENKESVSALILLGVAGTSITWNSLRKGERWAWYTLVLIVAGYDLVYVAIHVSIGYVFYVPIAIILLLLFAVGAALTAKPLFARQRD